MKQTHKSFTQRCIDITGSQKFFWGVIALLVLQASWIALSGRYPMAFDEDFHIGIITLYAHHLSPVWSSQPDGANMFGAIARDPSYLYHYLMSFPYRLIGVFTDNQTIQVLILRFLNIGLFATGLGLYRQLLLKTGVAKSLVHLSLLVLVLLPVVPLLAAQVNYDNLFLPLTALAMLLTVSFDKTLSKGRFDLKVFLQLLIVCMANSLVKYAFLPIFVATIGFVVVRIWLRYRSLTKLWSGVVASWKRLVGWSRVGLVLGFVVLFGLCLERYGVNLIRYHTPVPDCSKVLTVEQCSEYGPWIRDYTLKINKVEASHSPITFTHEWFYGMWLRTFFAVDGPATGFQTRGPLVVPGLSAIMFGVASGVAFLLALPRLLKRYDRVVIALFFTVTVIFIGLLWLDEFEAFVRTGKPVAINGRYLLPVMPLLLLMAVASWNELLGRLRIVKLVLAATAILCLLWGGGALTYILRSNDSWYWPGSFTRQANHAIQNTLGPITPGYDQNTQFLH
ncbi:MAG: hypothetical protein AAB436_04840 [Patescibacteria group bacterium]